MVRGSSEDPTQERGDEVKIQAFLKEFLASRLKNQWYESYALRVYVRKAHRNIGGTLVSTLDIASIDVEPHLRERGMGTAVIDYLHEQNPFAVTYIENVQTERFYEYLIARGWIPVGPREFTDHDNCLYKLK